MINVLIFQYVTFLQQFLVSTVIVAFIFCRHLSSFQVDTHPTYPTHESQLLEMARESKNGKLEGTEKEYQEYVHPRRRQNIQVWLDFSCFISYFRMSFKF